MNKFILRLSIILFAFTSCDMKRGETKSNEVERSMNQPAISENELKKIILSDGDKNAYDELSISYLDHPIQEEFLLYALVMANKYDYPQAYFDVFSCLTDIYYGNITKIDDKTATLAIEYLLQANEKGHHQANEIVQEYNIDIKKNIKQQIIKIFKE